MVWLLLLILLVELVVRQRVFEVCFRIANSEWWVLCIPVKKRVTVREITVSRVSCTTVLIILPKFHV